MPVTGGGNRKDLRPLERRDPGVLGSHSRQFEALNVANPQPGRVYQWARYAEGPIRKKINEGWRFVKEGDPEAQRLPPEEIPASMRTSLDSLRPFGDVALMWAPEDVRRRKIEALIERNRAALGGAEANFLQAGEKIAAEVGSVVAGSNPLYYVNTRRGHGYAVSTEEK